MNKINKVLVLGIGNILMSDDGYGCAVINHLRSLDIPAGVTLIDIGTAAISYCADISSAENIIIVDTIAAGNSPGIIYQLTIEDMNTVTDTFGRFHELSIYTLVRMTQAITGYPQKCVVFGIEPLHFGFSTAISPIVYSTIPRISDLILKLISDLTEHNSKK